MKCGLETAVYKPSSTRGDRSRGSSGPDCSLRPWKEPALPTPWLWTCSLQASKTKNACP